MGDARLRDTPPDPRRTPPIPWGQIALHALAAAAFFFVLQYVAMRASLETSLAWSGFMAVAAAAIAYTQSRRG